MLVPPTAVIGYRVVSDILLVATTNRELFAIPRTSTLCWGIGPIETTVATARALALPRSSPVLHVGIAGAARLEPGAVVIGSEPV